MREICNNISYKDNYIEALRKDLIATVEEVMTPVAIKYHYSETPLENQVKWRPLVLFLGNYSSGKSTLINELLGVEVQITGQAPTDDSFTVITYNDDNNADSASIEERDGKVLVNDSQFPFSNLAKHGQRFVSHFRLKKVKSPFLKNLAVIDTPGMVDSVAERDRGYDYQQVIGDLAAIADLILVLFDPHKAGTIKETYESLRKTLPTSTYEDRVLFVLNRIDECTNLNDLLRVYGTLCWNLSQMTGRKDIPMIYLTHSESLQSGDKSAFLELLLNQREDIKRKILLAPKFRLDHLATYIEEHGNKLIHFLSVLLSYVKQRRAFIGKMWFLGSCFLSCCGLLFYWSLKNSSLGMEASHQWILMISGAGSVTALLTWLAFVKYVLVKWFHKYKLEHLEDLTSLVWQSQKDSWLVVKPLVMNYLQSTSGKISLRTLVAEHRRLKKSIKRMSHDVRNALNEIASLE